jgi:hypothetical protein
MSAVVSAVSSVFEAVGDFVEDVVEAVGDVVEEVVDVVENVVEKVGDVVQAVIDDPLPVLLSVAGSFVGIPPAITMGAITAARGGDLEDIALSMGTAYFAPQVGNAISSTVSSAFVDAGFNEAFTQVASDSISKGFVNGTIAEIKGGSFDDGFAGGFTGGLVSGGVGEVASYVKDDVITLAQNNGLDLRDATAVFNAGTKAVSAGVMSEVTGRGDFVTSFTNSAVGSGVDYGARSLNSTIDEQFKTAITDWNKKDGEGDGDSLIADAVENATEGSGIPNELVGQVTVSSIGFDVTPDSTLDSTTGSTSDSTSDSAQVLADSTDSSEDTGGGETAVSDVSVLPDSVLTQAPKADTVDTFADLIGADTTEDGDVDTTVLADATTTTDKEDVPSEVADIVASLGETTEDKKDVVTPQGALATVSEVIAPQDLDVTSTEVKSDAPILEGAITKNLVTDNLAEDQPNVGGLNAVSTKTAGEKMAESLGLKPTDITKPIVASVGNLLKNTLKVGTKPVARKPIAAKPIGGLRTARVAPKKPTPPPLRMDVAKLKPIQKAAPSMPAQTLSSSANLTPVSDIASLTSLLKKAG